MKSVPIARNDPHVPLPARLSRLRDVLPAHAAARDWALLSLAASARPGEIPATVLRPLEALEVGASGLKALGGLRDLVQGPWPQNVKVEEVAAGVAAFAETASPQEASALRNYLALRARMEGQPDLARGLLPPGEALKTPAVLRDLKVLAEIHTTPPPTSPLGDVPLPEPEPLGVKAPVREAIDKDLPGLGNKLRAAELRARRGALRAIEASAETHWHHITLHLHNLKSTASARESDDREDEVERHLGRRLRPAERLLARRLLRTRKPAAVAAALRSVVRK